MYALHEARQALAGVDLVEGLATPEIHARLEIGARLGDTGQGILAFYLHEMDRLELHAITGHESVAKFAEDRLGLDRRRAAELVRVGERLASLPRVQAAFCEQRIGWTKLLLLVQVVSPEHEAVWLERAEGLNVRELRREVKLSRAGGKPRTPGDAKSTREVRFRRRTTLDAVTHEMVDLAKQKLVAEGHADVDDQSFMRIAAELILGTDEDGTTPGRTRVDASLYRVVLHAAEEDEEAPLEVDSELGLVPVDGGEGDDPLSRVRSACLRCDGDCVHEDGTPVAGKTPAAMRHKVLARDRHRCRCCGKRGTLHVHHIVFREQGGATKAWNLISLCLDCHGLVHAGLLVLRGRNQKRVRFHDRGGRSLARACEYAAPGALLLLSRPNRDPNQAPVGRREQACLATVPDVVDTAWWQRHVDLIRTRDRQGLELRAGTPRSDAREAAEGHGAVETPDPVEAADPHAAFTGLVGQTELLARLMAEARGCRATGRGFPHTLLTGPAGTGKTTLARGVAALAGTRLETTCGPLVQDTAALLRRLTSLREGDALFLDEIHAVPRAVLEVLYEAMAEGRLSLTLHAGLRSKAVCLDLPRFTLLAATTEEGLLDEALISRFGVRESLGHYDAADLAALIEIRAERAGLAIQPEAAACVAAHARGTPREALRLLERILVDLAGRGEDVLDAVGARAALARQGYDAEGLAPAEQRYLRALRRSRRPLALAQIARRLALGFGTVARRIEPELLRRGLVEITPRGRVATPPRSGAASAERTAGWRAERPANGSRVSGGRRRGPSPSRSPALE